MSNIANNLSAVTAWVTEHNQKTGYEPELDKIKVLCLKSMQGYRCVYKERDQPYLQCVGVCRGACKIWWFVTNYSYHLLLLKKTKQKKHMEYLSSIFIKFPLQMEIILHFSGIISKGLLTLTNGWQQHEDDEKNNKTNSNITEEPINKNGSFLPDPHQTIPIVTMVCSWPDD